MVWVVATILTREAKDREATTPPIAGLRTLYHHGPRQVNVPLMGIELATIGRVVMALVN